ncbi:MAG TPA: hypothetical protein VFV55_11610, partial [Usitatibacteraceae bacterium]|nr:hypothetical protein [Usitatibacteraceae bacterium]
MRGPFRSVAAALFAAAALASHAQGEFLVPPASLVLDGLPPIPAEIAAKAAPYTDFKPGTLLDWHPLRREILVRLRLGNADQLHRVAQPGATPDPLTDHPDAVSAGRYEPRAGNWLLFTRGTGGDEAFRIYRLDPAMKEARPVSPAGRRASAPEWNHKADRIVFTSVPVDRNNDSREARTTVHLADPGAPDEARELAELTGGGWFDFTFSPDDRLLAFVEYVSAEESHVWLMDVATGKRRRLTPPTRGEAVFYANPQFSPDGKG